MREGNPFASAILLAGNFSLCLHHPSLEKNILIADGWKACSIHIKSINSCSISDPQRGKEFLPVPFGESAEICLWSALHCLWD